jgi:hypothetical protein
MIQKSPKGSRRSDVELNFPDHEGWQWVADFVESTGFSTSTLSTVCRAGTFKIGGVHFERTLSGPYRYRLGGEQAPRSAPCGGKPEPLCDRPNQCALCACKTTRNRSRIFDKLKLCYPCHGLVFKEQDYESRRRLGL